MGGCQNYGPFLGYIGIMEKKMETTIMGYIGVIIGFTIGFYGWLSKLWPLFGYPK